VIGTALAFSTIRRLSIPLSRAMPYLSLPVVQPLRSGVAAAAALAAAAVLRKDLLSVIGIGYFAELALFG